MFAAVPLHRTNGSDGAVSVKYIARDVTARAGTHYRACSGEIHFSDGDLVKDIDIELLQERIRNVKPLVKKYYKTYIQ